LIYNNCIEILQHFQNAPYQFQPENFQIERMISRVKHLNAEEAYAKSCELEPPGPYELTLAGPDVASFMFNEKSTASGGGGSEKAPHTPKSASGQSSTSRENVNIKNKILSEGSKDKSDSSSTKALSNPSASPEERQTYISAQDTSDNNNRNENKKHSIQAKNMKEDEMKEPAKERFDEQMSSLETDSEIEI
jgi:hypothetical protein